MQPPVFDLDPAELSADPYPLYARMHAQSPICRVPHLGATLLTRRDDIYVCEKNVAVFASSQPQGLMTRLMGENMMRKDGEPHLAERRQLFPAVSPRTVETHWRRAFSRFASQILDDLEPKGSCDLVADYAMRLSGEALKAVTGLVKTGWRDIDAWSQAMIDGISNYLGDPQVEARCHWATGEIDKAISDRLAERDADDDFGMIAVLRRAGMPQANIRHNVKLAISGGQNEPRDAIAGLIHALLAHPDQYALVAGGKASFREAFEEYGRWISPIGMSPRRIARKADHAGMTFEVESRVFLMFGAANRDPAAFERAEKFEVTRDNSRSVTFGSGPHFCAGAHVARMLVAEIAVPEAFRRLRQMRLAGPVVYRGWAFRGPVAVPVRWDPSRRERLT